MKKTRVYSASDFESAMISVIIEDCYWTVDAVYPTKVGKHSDLPLFELQLKQVSKPRTSEDLPDGIVDKSADMRPSRTYYAREGRPIYNDLAKIWQGLGDEKLFPDAASKKLSGNAYMGHVVKLSGVNYTKATRDGKRAISRSQLELWYPEGYDPDVIMDDFVRNCNRGVYTPLLDDKPAKKQDDSLEGIDLSDIDPKILAALVKALKK